MLLLRMLCYLLRIYCPPDVTRTNTSQATTTFSASIHLCLSLRTLSLPLYSPYKPTSLSFTHPCFSSLLFPLSLLQAYVEYTSDGRVLKGVGKAPTRTKYEEDVYINNHTSVFGSYYSRVRALWGYSCCHSLMKNSYCTGQAGRVANDAANGQNIDVHQAR